MQKQIVNFREERDLGQILNATFAFIRENFTLLSRCILFFVAPFAILSGIFSGLYQSRLVRIAGESSPYSTLGEYNFFNQVTTLNYIIAAIFSVISIILVSLTVYCYLLEYMDNEGEVTLAGVWDRFKTNCVSILYSSFGAIIMVAIGSILFLLPGIYVATTLSILIIMMLREDIGFIEGVERCLYLIKGNWWATFGILFVAGMIQGIISIAAALPTITLTVLHTFEIPFASNSILIIAAASFGSIVSIFIYSITILAVAFQYFNLVEIKDGIGMLEQVDLIGQTQGMAEANDGEY